jgi:uncharacterized OB-fold protein
MPKPVPVPDETDQGFWDAINERRLAIQNCTECNRMQMPPIARCVSCGSSDHLEWKEVEGKGRVNGYCVQYDTRVVVLKENQPFNTAIIELAEDPAIKFFSHLPGVAVNEVPVGANVELIFEEVEPGRLVPEWQVVS